MIHSIASPIEAPQQKAAAVFLYIPLWLSQSNCYAQISTVDPLSVNIIEVPMSRNDEFDSNPFAASEMDLNAPAEQQPSGRIVYASFWQRFCAAIVDGILSAIVTSMFTIPMGFVLSGIMTLDGVKEHMTPVLAQSIGFLIGMIIGTLVGWLYFALQESSGAQATLGKRGVGIKVVGLSGERISFGRATGRYFGKMLSQLTLLIGYLIQPFTEKKQALHDMLAETLVVRD